MQLSALLDNAFNHPQFFPSYGDGFTQVRLLVNDVEPDNGDDGRPRRRAPSANQEGFAPGESFRIGLRATF